MTGKSALPQLTLQRTNILKISVVSQAIVYLVFAKNVDGNLNKQPFQYKLFSFQIS